MRLSLVISDFHLDPRRHVAAELAALPALPALGELLRRGQRMAGDGNWRSALAADLGAAEIGQLPPAVVAASAAEGAQASRGVWLAAPVHRVAGMSRVRLHPAGLLRLSPDQAAALCESFASVFAAEGLLLHPVGDGLLLEGLPAAINAGVDPAMSLGAELEVEPAANATDKQLRRLQSEVEMWLHEHELNRRRQQAGELVINGLWLWGGGEIPVGAVARQSTRIRMPVAWGSDPFLHGLARLAGQGAPRPCAGLGGVQGDDALVVVRAAAREPGDSPLQRLESDWFAPLLMALDDSRITSLRLRMGGWVWQLPVPAWRLWLRRHTAWWERFL